MWQNYHFIVVLHDIQFVAENVPLLLPLTYSVGSNESNFVTQTVAFCCVCGRSVLPSAAIAGTCLERTGHLFT
jgi:hypothetical protein